MFNVWVDGAMMMMFSLLGKQAHSIVRYCKYCIGQVSFHGKYNDRECGISFTAGEEDSGVWK